MRKNWTDGLALLAMALLLGGCATSKEELLPHNNRIMLDIVGIVDAQDRAA